MLQSIRAVFLDKDGTLIPDVPYNVNPDLISLQDGVIEGLKILKNLGYSFIVISNQAGVARGYFQIQELEKVKQKLDLLLNKEGIYIEQYYFCPHHIAGIIPKYSIDCDCRKPKPGMLSRAVSELNINASASWMVGDILNDVEAGNRAGCRSVLVDTGNETEWVEGPFREPAFVASNFMEAAVYIRDNTTLTSSANDKDMAAV